MYDRTSQSSSVNECRRVLFTRKNRAIENIPPTADALLQHTKRAALQAEIWDSCLDATANTSAPACCGWRLNNTGHFEPIWSTQPELSADCKQLISCSCKVGCSKSCKCVRSNLPCTQLCICEGQCSENVDREAPVYEQVEEDPEVDNILTKASSAIGWSNSITRFVIKGAYSNSWTCMSSFSVLWLFLPHETLLYVSPVQFSDWMFNRQIINSISNAGTMSPMI